MKPLFLLGTAALLLSGCGTIIANGPNQASTTAERHPITVDQQTVTLSVAVDPTSQGLHRDQLKKIDSFVTSYRTRGHGPITVTTPSGTSADIEAAQTAADIRTALNLYGIDFRDMQGATYLSGGRPEAVIISFSRYVASGPECGNFKGELSARLKNAPSPNFGCATQRNLAAMVADPRDLTRMQTADPVTGASATNPITAVETNEGSVNQAGITVLRNE